MRSVLHVLPHAGGGGETYVNMLAHMGGYRFERRIITSGPSVRRVDTIVASALRADRDACTHDLLHVHGEVAALLCLPALAARPSILTLHGINLLRRTTGARRRLAELNLRLIVAASRRTICVSQVERDEVVGTVGSSLARRVVLIRNGVPLPEEITGATRRAIRAELGISDSAVVAVCVGDLIPLKDPMTAARAALDVARETELVMCVAGDGPLRQDLERLARGSGTGALRVLGHRNDVERIYAASDIVVLASHRETLGYSVLEGMSFGLAPIVSDGIGCAEAAGETALVVPCGDVAGFAAALRRLATNGAERAARGAQARERVARWFAATRMIEQTRLLYDEVARRGRRAGGNESSDI